MTWRRVGGIMQSIVSVTLILLLLDSVGIINGICWFWQDSCVNTTQRREIVASEEKHGWLSRLLKGVLSQITSIPSLFSESSRSQPKGGGSSDFVGFIGRWHGLITERKRTSEVSHFVEIQISLDEMEKRIGTITYSSRGCSGELILDKASAKQLTIKERIIEGSSNCLDGTTITLTRDVDGTLIYNAIVWREEYLYRTGILFRKDGDPWPNAIL